MFALSFFVLAILCVLAKIWSGDGSLTQLSKNPEFRSFQINYLLVYFIMMGKDFFTKVEFQIF
jgi:hypothetical protein